MSKLQELIDEGQHGWEAKLSMRHGGLQGQELLALRKLHGYRRIIYCGDGQNDLCPSLDLRAQDALLARRDSSLHRLLTQHDAESSTSNLQHEAAPDNQLLSQYIKESSPSQCMNESSSSVKTWPDGRSLSAPVHYWSTHLELAALAQRLLSRDA